MLQQPWWDILKLSNPPPGKSREGERNRGMETRGFEQLIKKAQAGDRKAMDQVLAAVDPYLRKIASSYADPVRPVKSTMDLLQDSNIRAWENIESFEGGGADEETLARFRAWISQILRRTGLNARRARRADQRSGKQKVQRLGPRSGGAQTTVAGQMDPASPGPSPSGNIRMDERTQRIEEALRKLPRESDAEIVRMHFFGGMALPEVAQKLDMKYNYVRDRFRVSMQRLQVDLSKLL